MMLEALSRHRSWLYSAGIAALIALWLASGQLGGGDAAMMPLAADRDGEAELNSVRVRTQTAEQVTRMITVNGKTAPARTVELSAETEGRVSVVAAARGANVSQGELIVRLDERDRSARLAQAEALVRQREVEFAARQKLKSQSYVSEAQLQESVAQLETARMELARARLDLEHMDVRAPFDGALQSRVVEIGDFVKSGDPIATFVDNRKIVVSADISEFDARYVQVGDAGAARLATGEQVSGRIRYVAPVADEATRTYTVELEVDNGDGRLRAGGTAELLIPAELVSAHRISPSLLTLDDAGNIGIKLVGDQGRVEFFVADIAMANADGVWITGLPSTATFITVGQGFVTEGALVRAVSEADVETALAVKDSADSGSQ